MSESIFDVDQLREMTLQKMGGARDDFTTNFNLEAFDAKKRNLCFRFD